MTRRHALVASALTVGYRGRAVVRGFNCSAAPGSTVAITGPSGSGKSTLLFALSGLLSPLSGTVSMDGCDVSMLGEAARAKFRATRVGFVFQDALLDPTRSTLDLVTEGALYAGIARRSVETWARTLLDGLGVGELATRRPGQLSGGQAQRVAMARALALRPMYLFADEPTANLDEHNAAVVLGHMFGHVRDHDAVLVVATHSPTVAAGCDQEIRL